MPDSGKIFPLGLRNTQQYFSRIYKKLNIKAVVHSFRHTFFSCCNHLGFNMKVVQKWGGHRSIVTTMDVYVDIIDYKNTPILDYLKKLKKTLKI